MSSKTSNLVSTAAGQLSAIKSGKSEKRGGTTVWLGTREDGKFVVSSRWQYEIITTDRVAAERKYASLVGIGGDDQ